MGIFVVGIGVIVVLFGLRWIYKMIMMQRVYMSYLVLDESDKPVEIRKEYLNKKKHDFQETVYDDLELKKVFQFLNHTQSDVGKEYMYGRMFMSMDHHQELENLIQRLDDERLIKKCLYSLYCLNTGYDYGLDFFEHIPKLKVLDYVSIALSYLLLIWIILSVAVFHDMHSAVIWGFVELFLGGLLYTRIMRVHDEVMTKVIGYCYCVECMNQLCHYGLFLEHQSAVKSALKYIKIERIFMWISKIDIFYLFDTLKGLLMLPLIQAYILFKHKAQLENDYLTFYECIGKLDLALTVKKIRENYQTCIPVCQDEMKIRTLQCYHPLIREAVKNDFETYQCCMITGSNASGKSTFMKTLGVNLILARALHTCFADEFYFGDYPISTSIHMKDDLMSGESYYVKEIQTLKHIIDRVHCEKCYVFIDEILRGTNEKERIEISRVILNDLFSCSSIVFITTHDLKLVDYFLDQQQYCFIDQIKDDQLYCDYKIRKGVCRIGNAIQLLHVYKYPQNILEQLHIESNV